MKYRFGPFELDRERFLLAHEHRSLRVEPRVLETLAYLVAHPGRLVTRDELVEVVWQGRHVTDAAVSRAVAEARRTLREAGSEHPWIETVYGRGFVFTGEVETVVDESEGPARPVDSAAGSSVSQPVSPAAPRQEEEPVGPVSVTSPLPDPAAGREQGATATPGASWASGAEGSSSASSPSRSLRWNWWLPAVLVLLGTVYLGARGVDSVQDRELSSRTGIRIAVLPFQAEGVEAHTPILALSLAERVALRLGREAGIVVVPPERAATVGVAAASPGAYRDAFGVDYLLEAVVRERPAGDVVVFASLGQITEQGGLQRVPLPPVGLPVVEVDSVEQFARLRDEIAGDLVDSLLPALPLPPGRPGGVSPEAYGLYLESLQQVQASICDSSAIRLMDEALQLAPGFAEAWFVLAWTHYSQVQLCVADGGYHARARTAVGRARELAPDATGPVLLEAIMLAGTGRMTEAFELLAERRRVLGDRPDLLFGESLVLRYAGRLEESQARIDRLLEIEPGYLVEGGWVPNSLLYLGRYERFREEMPAYDSAYKQFYLALSWIAEGDRERARAVLAHDTEDHSSGIYCSLLRVFQYALDGETVRARRVLDGLVERRSAVGSRDGEMTYKIAQLYALAGEHASAQEQVELAIEQGFLCGECLQRDPLLSPLQGTAAWTAVVGEARRRGSELRPGLRDVDTVPDPAAAPRLEVARLEASIPSP